MQMHPGSNQAGVGSISLALNLIDFTFDGKASHAAASPWLGRSALDGVMMMFNGIEYMREHVKQDIRIHGIVTNGGQAANIVPEKAAARFYVRGLERPYLNTVVERVYDVARGAALATGTTVTIKEVKQYDNVVNVPSFMAARLRLRTGNTSSFRQRRTKVESPASTSSRFISASPSIFTRRR